MKEIKLTKGQVALVDDEDYEYLNQWKWQAHESYNNFYAMRSYSENNKTKHVLMHRLIMKTKTGYDVDHIDHNGLNNQKNNLRNCSRSDNLKNNTPRGRSRYMGVRYQSERKNGKVYEYICSQITVNGKWMHLGLFKTEEDAAMAYDNAARKYFGEYANLNFK